jgi:putative glutamine amidotransferase
MAVKSPVVRIGIYGLDPTPSRERHGCGLWPAGFAASIQAAEAEPVSLDQVVDPASWDEVFQDLHGVVLINHEGRERRSVAQAESLCQWCRENDFPILAVDQGLHILNSTFSGTCYQDVARELPEALQHRHPPEKGLRHAIEVLPGTRLARLYGEGEIVVNSEHRKALQRLARGFNVCARALDGVIEAIESASEDWFALGVQWQPASSTASGLDVQLFRGLAEACKKRLELVPG